MAHPKLILKRIQLYTIHLQLPSSKYALTRSYEFGHYRSFWKVNKNTFFVKASYMRMECQIEMRPKGFLIGHLKLSKKSNNTFKESKLRKLCIGEVDPFCKIVKSQLCLKLQFLPNGPNLLHLFWVGSMVHEPYPFPLIIILFLLFILIFIWIKSILIKTNHEKIQNIEISRFCTCFRSHIQLASDWIRARLLWA